MQNRKDVQTKRNGQTFKTAKAVPVQTKSNIAFNVLEIKAKKKKKKLKRADKQKRVCTYNFVTCLWRNVE